MHLPPKFPIKILRFFCAKHRLEELEGDLFEEFQDQVEANGLKKARRLYFWTVVRSFRKYLFDYQRSPQSLGFITLWKHYFKTSLRSMLKQKTFSAINILGLGLGLACSVMLSLYIADVVHKDNFIPNRERIYRLDVLNPHDFTDKFEARTHPGFGTALLNHHPQIENFCRINQLNKNLDITITEGDQKKLFRAKGIIADTSFFSFFPFPLAVGNEQEVLSKRYSIVLSQSLALRFFGEEAPINKTVYLPREGGANYTVTGILKDISDNSSIRFDYLIPNYLPYGLESWGYSPFANYFLLAPNTDPDNLAKDFNKTTMALNSHERFKNLKYRLTEFEELKFTTASFDGIIGTMSKSTLVLFAIVALLILILAVFNYINLTVSRALQRAQQAGVRKIIGAGKGSFLLQFLTESLIFCFISMLVALLTVRGFTPYFESIIGHPLHSNYQNSLSFYFIYISSILLLALFSAFYPALLVTRFKPNEFLKGRAITSVKGNSFRKGLVVFQFTIAIVLALGAIMVHKQLKYLQNETLAYSPEQILTVGYTVSSQLDDFKKSLEDIPEVSLASLTSSPPSEESLYSSGPLESLGIRGYYHRVDAQYMEMLGLEMVKGEKFDGNLTSEIEQGVIINETLAKIIEAKNPMGLDEPLSGKYLFMQVPTKIRGVVKDFHIGSLHNEIKPMILMYHDFAGYSGARVMIQLSTTDLPETLSKIEKKWKEFIPNSQFNAQFMDAQFDQLYTSETRLARIFNIFTGIAILISCLGLLGLIGFITESKVKEVGIRKVMGASTTQILLLFTKQVYQLILLACLIGSPIAYWFVNRWLNNFAYKTNFSLTVTFVVILSAFLIAGITIVLRSGKTATSNPVQALRSQ